MKEGRVHLCLGDLKSSYALRDTVSINHITDKRAVGSLDYRVCGVTEIARRRSRVEHRRGVRV